MIHMVWLWQNNGIFAAASWGNLAETDIRAHGHSVIFDSAAIKKSKFEIYNCLQLN